MPETRGLPKIMLSRFRHRPLAAMIFCLWLAGCAPGPASTAGSDKAVTQERFITYTPPSTHPAAVTASGADKPAQAWQTAALPQRSDEPPVAASTPIIAPVPVPTVAVSALEPEASAVPVLMPVETRPSAAEPEKTSTATVIASPPEKSENSSLPAAAVSENATLPGPDTVIAANETPQPAGSTTVSDYFLSPGDVIEISVWGEEMTREVIVPPDGKISYFLIGQIRIAGRTMEEIRSEIEARLAEYIVNPKPIVLGKSFIGNAASVLGAVNQPGQKTLNPGDRVTDLLAKAGGFMYILGDNTSEDSRMVADLPNAYLSRQGKNQDIDMARLLDQGDMNQNVLLQKGDLLFIPYTKQANVYALGEVANPMVIHFRDNLTLLDAIAHAGGLNKTTYRDEVCIVRGSLKNPEVIRLHYPSILKGIEPNRLLMAGDIVYVPATVVTSVERLSRQIIPFLDVLVRRKEAM